MVSFSLLTAWRGLCAFWALSPALSELSDAGTLASVGGVNEGEQEVPWSRDLLMPVWQKKNMRHREIPSLALGHISQMWRLGLPLHITPASCSASEGYLS